MKTQDPNDQRRDSGRTLDIAGRLMRYFETGAGESVILLQAEALDSSLRTQLAPHFRIIALEVAHGDFDWSAKAVCRVPAALGIDHYSLIGGTELARLAISQAIADSAHVDALVLIAPAGTLEARPGETNGSYPELELEAVKAPTLVLFGSREQARALEEGRRFAQRIPSCFYTLVHDAQHEIEAERPQALLAVVRDFLEHREKFIVGHGSSAINP